MVRLVQLGESRSLTVTDEHGAQSRRSWDRRDVLRSALVLAMILMAYLYFRG